MRITIIGYSGGGKTFLAQRISEQLHIPHQQIDRVWFEAGGHIAKSEEEKELVRTIVSEKTAAFAAGENWVSDGFYSRAQGTLADKADYVVVIELPLWRRLYNHWKRILLRENRHPETTVLQDLFFSKEIIRRTFTFKPKLKKFKEAYKDKVVIITSHKEADAFLATLTSRGLDQK